MDEFDEDRFARGAPALPHSPVRPARRADRAGTGSGGGDGAGRVIHCDDDRKAVLCPVRGGPGVIRVRALTEVGQQGVRQEMQLLAALEVGGLAAAPSVLEIEDQGYVRENGTPLGIRRGRRSADSSAPPTQERQAQSRARADLDGLIDALHERGWVLGAPIGEGLGRRADGSVIVLDLSGLRPERAHGVQIDDRLWVDSVLQDSDRTLRRRIDAIEPATAPSSAPFRADGERAALPVTDSASEDLDDGFEDEVDPTHLRPLPAPRTPSRSVGARRLARRSAALSREALPPDAWLTSLGRVLGASGPRRVALLSAVSVLLAGGALGSGIWLMAPDASPPPPAAQGGMPAPAAAEDRSGPSVTDPISLATDLAHARHEYITGVRSEPVAAPGSPALSADEQVRTAYEGTTVEGGQPRVHSAEVVSGPDPQGTASLQVEISTEAHTVLEADGSTTPVEATGRAVIRLDLLWSEGRWCVADSVEL